MFPPQTSLIPVTVALSRFAGEFINKGGWPAIRSLGEVWYPFWYLGVPYRYLTGPIIPLANYFVYNLFPSASLFSITIYFVLISFIFAGLGWGILAQKIQNRKSKILSLIIFVLFLVFPWKYLASLALAEGSVTISKNLLPFALIFFWSYLEHKTWQKWLVATLALSALLLINNTVISAYLVGIVSLIVSHSYKKGKFKDVTKFIKPTLFLILSSLFLVTFWYTVSYWIVVVTNPSIGGAAGYKVFLRIINLLRSSIPLFLAIVAVYFSGKVKRRLSVFSLTWLLTFLFLSIYRFIGDYDFWQDWSAWFSELEVGLAFLVSAPLFTVYLRLRKKKDVLVYSNKIYFVVLALLLLPFLLSRYIYFLLDKPKLLSASIPEGVASLEKLSGIAGGSRVFISGSTVFWANAIYDLIQVRGGVDKAATHPLWDHAAYQLREGTSYELARAWLKALGVEYVLIHGPGSSETYHDFRNISKWNDVGQIVWEEEGDAIIKTDNSQAWIVDLAKLKSINSQEGGEDLMALKGYLSAKKRGVKVESVNNNRVVIEFNVLDSGEGIVFAESFNTGWKADQEIKIEKDPLGNILLITEQAIVSPINLIFK